MDDTPGKDAFDFLAGSEQELENAFPTRGLTNSGSSCFMNASLQALLACRSFVTILSGLAKYKNEMLAHAFSAETTGTGPPAKLSSLLPRSQELIEFAASMAPSSIVGDRKAERKDINRTLESKEEETSEKEPDNIPKNENLSKSQLRRRRRKQAAAAGKEAPKFSAGKEALSEEIKLTISTAPTIGEEVSGVGITSARISSLETRGPSNPNTGSERTGQTKLTSSQKRRLRQKKKHGLQSTNKSDRGISANLLAPSASTASNFSSKGLHASDQAFLPRFPCVLKNLSRIPGNQEDAHEFLELCLSGLHEELKQLLRTRFGKQNTKFDHKEGSWSEVGVKNKKRVVVANGFGKEGRKETCISHAFRGNLRIVLSKKSAGMKDTVSSQPFFSLHLNVAEHGIDSVERAVDVLMSKESVEGFHSKSSLAVEAAQSFSIDTLPKVLIFHLKRFVVGIDEVTSCGGGAATVRKITKRVTFPLEFSFRNRHLFGLAKRDPGFANASSSFEKSFQKGKNAYRLRSVVVHHGQKAGRGHYTAYVRKDDLRPNKGGFKDSEENSRHWVHCDDSIISPTNEGAVLGSQAYILLYEQVAY